MQRWTFSELTLPSIESLVRLHELGMQHEFWEALQVPLTPRDQQQIDMIISYLRGSQPIVMNEATIWSRGIYPLLLLAETGSIQAWAQVPLRATYARFELEGFVDGVIGHVLLGQVNLPYLVIVETKRGIDAPNPQYQLIGAMLAAAWMNQQRAPQASQEIFGCYTVADQWTFVHGNIAGFEADWPSITVRLSREYPEQYAAETIGRILKGIVAQFTSHANEPRQAA